VTDYLTTGDLAALTGMRAQNLRNWAAWGFLVPTRPGPRGRMRGHRYSRLLAVGLLVARWLQNSPRGCSLKYAAKVIQAFDGTPEDLFLDRIRAGRVWFLGLNGDLLVLLGSCMGLERQPNVASMYRQVCRYAKAKAAVKE